MLYLAVCAALGTSHQAQALGGLADVEIVDRDTGALLTPHYYRGEYWVAGKPGARYAIEIRNRLGERMLAVTSVDGVNVISGETAAWDQTGYVFTQGEQYEITGWRKSDAEIAAFTFTDASGSYAELTGRPANVGVIGVAVFRERRPPAVSLPPPILDREQPLAQGDEAASTAESGARAAAPPGAAPPTAAAPPAAAPAPSRQNSAPADFARRLQAPSITRSPLPEAKLGTGHGEREYSYVTHTDFARLQPEPNEVIRIRYDSMERLLAMGIIKRPRPVPPTIHPFPGSPGSADYVPDPPG
jgi:hypothetical protein